MEGLEDDFVIPNQDQGQQNIANFESAPNSLHKYCLLCKYGSCSDHETDGNVNQKIKTIEKIIASLRGKVCRTKVSPKCPDDRIPHAPADLLTPPTPP
tara:strand:- start:3892 stop:4185 length:294 start_codon:yes stop_codon:yes gene_type:complete